MKTATKQNYTAEQVEQLKAGYTGADNKAEVAALAQATGKSQASIRAKLSNLGIYRSAEAAETKATQSKRDLVELIAQKANLSDADKDGLEKATKGALDKIVKQLSQ